MLTLILGPSGSGKSVRLREELRQRARSRQRSILIVPEQFTSSTEGALYHALGDELSAYVESYSFTSLAETLLRRYGGAAVPTLSEAGRAVLVRRAMDEMMDKVVYYSRQRRSAAFCQKAAETISELKSAGIRPETLADYANAPGADKDKLGELALILEPMKPCWPKRPWTPATAWSWRPKAWTRLFLRAARCTLMNLIHSTTPSAPCWRPCCRLPM